MKELIGSQTKVDMLLYLALRGGCSGRCLARTLKKSPTQVFKALSQLEGGHMITRYGAPSFYALNPRYRYYHELLSMLHKAANDKKQKKLFYMPRVSREKRIDPESVYELLALRGQSIKVPKLSDILRERYA